MSDASPTQRWVTPATLAGVVATLALVPVLREPHFYFWDDSAAVFVPTWRAIGLDLLAGRWPTLRPDLWMGGNWAAEAQFGLWNPVNLAAYVVVALLPDLAVAATVVKVGFMVLFAEGAYVLLREHGAARGPAAAVASALPFTGFTLYADASMWASGLLALAWTPWFWWSARRFAGGRLNPAVVWATGYLLLTSGSPYGALAAVVTLVGVGAGALLARDGRVVARLVLVGACTGTAAAVAFLPTVLSASVGWRGGYARVFNNGDLGANLTLLAGSGSPSLLPAIRFWDDWGASVPLAYGLWFGLPLLAWADAGALRRRAPGLVGALVAGAVFLALALGPSDLWLFRWPIRLLPYVYLSAAVVVAVAASALRTDHAPARLAASAVAIVAGGWIAFSARPDLAGDHLASTLLGLALTAALGLAALRVPGAVPAVLVAGTAAVLAWQTAWVPVNTATSQWRFPTAVTDLEDWAAAHPGPVVQVANAVTGVPSEDRPAVWKELQAGALPAAAGVESTVSYTGIGFTAFASTLCLDWNGTTCAGAFARLWLPAGNAVTVPHLADSLRARTVVVQKSLVPDAAERVPEGWAVDRQTERVVVLRRLTGLSWPESRLAATTPGITIRSAAGGDTNERIRLDTPAQGGALQFARLAWPGHTASVAGRPLPVHENDQGLVELVLPGDLSDALVVLDFRPPGYGVAIPLLGAGVAGAAALAFAWGNQARAVSVRRGGPPPRPRRLAWGSRRSSQSPPRRAAADASGRPGRSPGHAS